MKFEKNDHYFTIAIYVITSVLCIAVGLCILNHLGEIWQWIKRGTSLFYMLFEPLIIGFVIAYLLDPLVGFYDSRCFNIAFPNKFHLKKHTAYLKKEKRWTMRTVPTLLAFLTSFCVLGLFILMIQMNITQVAGSFSMSNLRESLTESMIYFEKMISDVNSLTNEMGITKGRGLIEWLYSKVNHLVLGLYQSIADELVGIGMHTINIILAFVVSFYLLQDKAHCLASSQKILRYCLKPRRYEKVATFGREVDKVFSSYIRGEIIDSIIMIILTSGALLLVQLDFAIMIGFISGIFNLIPYFGPIVGFALAIIIGLLDPNPVKALYGAGAIIVIQQIDGWFIVPKIVGDSVKLHPIIVLLAIVIGSNLFGLIGMLLAVPVAALIRLIIIRSLPDTLE